MLLVGGFEEAKNERKTVIKAKPPDFFWGGFSCL